MGQQEAQGGSPGAAKVQCAGQEVPVSSERSNSQRSTKKSRKSDATDAMQCKNTLPRQQRQICITAAFTLQIKSSNISKELYEVQEIQHTVHAFRRDDDFYSACSVSGMYYVLGIQR